MKPMKRMTSVVIVLGVSGLSLGGCVSFDDIDAVNTMRTTSPQQGTPFTHALSDEYQRESNRQADKHGMWSDAAWFARKGLRASNGEVVLPSAPVAAPDGASYRSGTPGEVVQIPAGRVDELATARGRLIGYLDHGGRDQQPVFAAHAQGVYDCWLLEEWETYLSGTWCRDEYRTIQTRFTVAAAPAPMVTQGQNNYQVFFDFDKSDITPTAAQIIRQAAADAMQGKVTSVRLTGHTDTVGSTQYNQLLSERRAETVKVELVKDGVPPAEIATKGDGKTDLLVPTADGVRKLENRRTTIILQ